MSYTSIVIRIASTTNLKFSTFLSKTVSSFQLSERNVISNLGWSLPRIAIFSFLTNNSNFVVILFGKHKESSFLEEHCSHVCDYYEVYIFVCNTTASQICNHSAPAGFVLVSFQKVQKKFCARQLLKWEGSPETFIVNFPQQVLCWFHCRWRLNIELCIFSNNSFHVIPENMFH